VLASATPPTPVLQSSPKIYHVPSAVFTGELNITNALVTQATLEFAHEGLTEWTVTTGKDTYADVDLVRLALVEQIESRHLAHRFKLPTPIHLGAVNTPHALTITHAIELPLREGDVHHKHTYAIADIPGPPDILQGRPWIDKFCPEIMETIRKFGQQSIGPTEEPSFTRKPPINTLPLSPKLSPQKPLAFGPCKDPKQAYFAGGGQNLLAAIESEQFRRQELHQQHVACLRIRAQIELALENHHHTAQVKAAAATGSNDPGVRGLTGNKEGWLDTIPPEFKRFADTVFSDEAANELPPYRPDHDCTIQLREGAKLKTCKLYDMSQEELKQLKALLDLEIQRGFIKPSKSESSAPVFFVRDPTTGGRSGQLRLVIDYRDLNSKIVLDEYPIPLSRTLMNDLAGADWITAMDVRSGFANLRMAPGSEKATAFKTFFGSFEYTIMPMGLATAPSVFQRFINSVLNPYLGIFCHAYLDDVVIFTKGSLDEHKEHVRLILEALRDNGLRLKPHKCKWFTKECNFLGFNVVCGKGIRMAEDKIQGIRNLPPPRGLTDLRSFLGMVGFYDKFIPHYSDTTACLTNLTKKDQPWEWTSKHQAAFDRILSNIRDDIFIRAFQPGKPVRLSTDASDEAYAGILEQEYNDGWHPFLLFHHKFHAAEKNWDIHDKELYAIVHAFSQYRHYLAQTGHVVQVFTDHRNLAKFMFSTNLLKSHDGRLGRWWETLSQCNFQIQYLPGSENVIPDFLSRYGYEASSEAPSRVLLPELRFSDKALADIQSWFKKSPVSDNIRKRLEERFAKNENQNSSPDPVQDPTFPSVKTLPRTRVNFGNFTPQQRKMAHLLSNSGYSGISLDIITNVSANHRRPGDRRGIGAPLDPAP
jgi:hypothetical protein